MLTAGLRNPHDTRVEAMANEVQAAEPAKNVNAGKVTVALVIACAIVAFFYFDLGRFLSRRAQRKSGPPFSLYRGELCCLGRAIYSWVYRGDGALPSRRRDPYPRR